MLRMRMLLGGGVVLLLALLLRLTALNVPNAEKTYPAPDFPLDRQASGLPAHLSDLHGRVVLIDCWATWCGPCRASIPELERLYEKYKAQGLMVIGMSMDDERTRSFVPSAQKALGITYPIAYGMDIPDFRDKYEASALPTLYVIDKQGDVRFQLQGYDPQGKLEEKIAPLLKE